MSRIWSAFFLLRCRPRRKDVVGAPTCTAAPGQAFGGLQSMLPAQTRPSMSLLLLGGGEGGPCTWQPPQKGAAEKRAKRKSNGQRHHKVKSQAFSVLPISTARHRPVGVGVFAPPPQLCGVDVDL